MARIARCYGKNRVWGEVFKSEKGSWLTLRLGYQLGDVTYEIKKEKDGNLKLERIVRKKDGNTVMVPVGKAFKNKTKNGKDYWKFTLGLIQMWDPEAGKNIVLNNDGLFLSIYILDEEKQKKLKTKDGKEYSKIGIVAGQIGIETDPEELIESETDETEESTEEEVPF